MPRRTVYGIKSERLPEGIVWHVMKGWKDDKSSFATWTQALSLHTHYASARMALRSLER